MVDELYAWINEVRQTLIPGDSLASAIQYAINQEQFFRRCFEDGRFEIDNGEVERRIRAPAIGRKNYLFAGSDAAAQRLAIVYTILGCCHMHGVNPANFVADVLDKIQNGWPQSRIDELLPHRWVPRGPEEFMASLTPLQP